MKKTALLLFAGLIAFASYSEMYLQKGLKWRTTFSYYNPMQPVDDSSYLYYIDSDTIVNGESCLLITRTDADSTYAPKPVGILKVDSDNSKVYCLEDLNNTQTWRLIYDFGFDELNEEATIYIPFFLGSKQASSEVGCRYLGTTSDPNYPDMELMKIYEFSPGHSGDWDSDLSDIYSEYWIKGLGSTHGIMHSGYAHLTPGSCTTMDYAMLNDSVIWVREGYTLGVNDISTDRDTEIRIRKSSGAIMISGLKAGQEYMVTAIDGTVLSQGKAATEEVTIPCDRKGIYIVSAGNSSHKLRF